MTRVLSISLLCLAVVMGVYAQVPPTPTSLTAVQVNSEEGGISVKLTWQVTEGNFGIRVYRSVSDTSHFAPIAITSGRTFYDHMVTAGTHYYYYVKSFVGSQE